MALLSPSPRKFPNQICMKGKSRVESVYLSLFVCVCVYAHLHRLVCWLCCSDNRIIYAFFSGVFSSCCQRHWKKDARQQQWRHEVRMSTGLMSCVRENSPPLEGANDTISSAGAMMSLPPETPEPQKRRRFNALKNLRRIFRRRTVTSAGELTSQNQAHQSPNSQQYRKAGSSPESSHTTSLSSNRTKSSVQRPGDYSEDYNTLCKSGDFSSSNGGDGYESGRYFCNERRELSADSAISVKQKNHQNQVRSNKHFVGAPSSGGVGGVISGVVCDQADSDSWDMTDYQRSLSEGRLIDSDFNRDPLSQSHDSVFSESATASSLSFVLKAELVDVLRKRRNRPEASDEDLGLPRSPTTPQGPKSHLVPQPTATLINVSTNRHSSSSVSAPGGGSDTEEDLSSTMGNNSYSYDTSKSLDETDLDLSVSSRLSHSAARHKMAVRPKKKGPSRPRRSVESSALPSTPELNEESMMKYASDRSAKMKSMSLPPGVNPKAVQEHIFKEEKQGHQSLITATATSTTNITTASTTITSTSIYTNHKIAKSHDFGRETKPAASVTTTHNNNNTMEKSHDEEGFFKKLLHRNGRKKDVPEEGEKVVDRADKLPEMRAQPLDKPDKPDVVAEKPQKLIIETKPYDQKMSPEMEKADMERKNKCQKSGPAARQRIFPKDLSLSPDASRKISNELIEKEKLPIKSPKKSPNSLDRSTEFIFVEQQIKPRLYLKSTTVNQTHSKSDELLNSPSEEMVSYTSSLSRDGWPVAKVNKKAKIAGLSPFQQRVSEIDSPEETSPKRKPVEKSKSFRIYTGNNNDSNDNMQISNNLPSLPDLSSPDKYEAMDLEKSPTKSPNHLTLKFEINDNNLVKSREDLSRSYPCSKDNKPSITVSNPPSSLSNNNISQIEENIDKLVKGSFVTVLKKSPTVSSTEFFPEMKTNNKGNVSITTITSSPIEVRAEIKPQEEINIQSSNEDVAIRETPVSTLTRSRRISPSILEKSSSSGSLTSSSSSSAVPEFMKIQLNRVDSTRPKSHVVLSKNIKESDTLPRRSSSEALDKEKDRDAALMKPPLPPDVANLTLKRMSINKSQETITESNPVIIVPKSPVKKTAEIMLKKPEIPRKIEMPNASVPLTTASVQRKPSFETAQQSVNRKPSLERGFSRDSIDNNKDGNNNVRQVVLERRRSVSDEKAKIERRISVSDEIKGNNERKKSTDGSSMLRKTSSSDDENVVIMRKKSNGSCTNKEDNTPELMKVFARRSLKLKDTDDIQMGDDKGGLMVETNKKFNLNVNLDSDKENQSSSEEKLDRISIKAPEMKTITLTKMAPNLETSKGVDVIIEKNVEVVKPDNVVAPLRKTSGSGANLQGPKPFGITPSRFSSNINYRNSTSFLDVKKTMMHSPNLANPAAAPVTNVLDKIQKSNVINNNTISMPFNKNTIETSIKNGNVLNNNNSAILENNNSIIIQDDNQVGKTDSLPEFKGILERRAEWEKRAKAFK